MKVAATLALALALGLSAAAQEPPKERLVYLDTLLSDPKTVREGWTPHKAAPATMGANTYPRSLMTDLTAHANIQSRFAAVTFALDKKYEEFNATIGRDNVAQSLGESYCYFEVWADGKKVYSSPAVRSHLATMKADWGPASKVKAPQDVRLDVRGVSTLKLVVTMVEFRQVGPRVNRACGCTWGDARLTLKPGESVPQSDVELPYERAVAHAMATLMKRLPSHLGDPGEPPRMAVAPVLMDAGAPGREQNWRALLLNLIGRQPGLALLEPTQGSAFAQMLRGQPEKLDNHDALSAIARSCGADLVMVARILEDRGWKVELRLLESAAGTTIASAIAPVKT